MRYFFECYALVVHHLGSLHDSLQELKKKLSTGSYSQSAAWKRVIGIIFSLSTDDETAEELLEMGGVDILLELLHQSLDPRICGILLNISNNEQCREEIVDRGGIAEVCKVLKRKADDSMSVEYATGALLNLVQDEKSTDDLVSYPHIFEILGEALENDLSKEAQTNVISLISNIIVSQTEKTTGNEDMIRAIVIGLKSPHKTVVTHALNCVWNMSVERDKEVMQKLFKANALNALGEAMPSLEGEEAENCLVCMSLIMESLEELSEDIKECIEEIIEILSCEDLKKATGAAVAVWNISQNNELGVCIPIETVSTLSTLLGALVQAKDIKGLEKVLGGAISLLSQEYSRVEQLVSNPNSLLPIYMLLEKEILSIPFYEEDEEGTYRKCLEYSVMLCCICSENKKGETVLLNTGIITELIDLLTLKRNINVKSKEYITACLYNVSSNNEFQRLILQMDAITSIMPLAQHSSKRLSNNATALLTNLTKNSACKREIKKRENLNLLLNSCSKKHNSL